jgi:hypothetical protein
VARKPTDKREPPVLNVRSEPPGSGGLRDLEAPTHAFPIGTAGPKSRARRRTTDVDEIFLGEAPVVHRGDDDYPDTPAPPPRRPVMVDARWVAAWLAAATMLAVIAALAGAIAFLYR